MFKSKEFRRDHSLYQSEMASILNLSQSAISRLEVDGLDLSKKQLELLYDKFGKEDVDKYIVIAEKEREEATTTTTAIDNLTRIVEQQNRIIETQIEEQNTTMKQILSTNERLVAILEKVAVE